MQLKQIRRRAWARRAAKTFAAIGLAPLLTPSFVYPEPVYQVPPGSPTLQTGQDTFAGVPVSSNVIPTGPTISRMTNDFDPGFVIALAGDNFNSDFFLDFWSPGFRIVTDPTQSRIATAKSPTTNLSAWAVPLQMARKKGLLVVPRNSTGFGRPVICGKAHPVWLQDIGSAADVSIGLGDNHCVVGNTVVVYGDNLCQPQPCSSNIAIDNSQGTITFTIPPGLSATNVSPGMYVFAVPNGNLIQQGNSIEGPILSYSAFSGDLTITVTKTFTGPNGIGGTGGAFKGWDVYITGFAWIWLGLAGSNTGQYIQNANITRATPYSIQFTLPGGLRTKGTSVTSITPAVAQFTLVTQSGLGFAQGDSIQVVGSGVGVRTVMNAIVDSYIGTSLTFTVSPIGFATDGGTYASWTIQPVYDVWIRGVGGPTYGFVRCPMQIVITELVTYGMDYNSFGTQVLTANGTDDTANIQNAINAVGLFYATNRSGRIKLNGGTYNLSAQLSSGANGDIVDTHFSLEDNGTGPVIINVKSGAGSFFNFMYFNQYCQIKNITLDGTGGTFTDSFLSVARLINTTITDPFLTNIACNRYDYNQTRQFIVGNTITGATTYANSRISGYYDSNTYNQQVHPAGGDPLNAEAWVWTQGGWINCAMTNNTLRQTGIGRPRLTVASGVSYNFYAERIDSYLPSVAGTDPNGGEWFLPHAPNTAAENATMTVVSTDNSGLVSKITVNDASVLLGTPCHMYIKSGKGVMQSAVIVNRTGNVLTLDRLLTVPPIPSSGLATCYGLDYAVIFNSSVRSGTGNDPNTANSVMSYNSYCSNVIIDNVFASNLTRGFEISGNSDSHVNLPTLWSLTKNTSITDCKAYVRLVSNNQPAFLDLSVPSICGMVINNLKGTSPLQYPALGIQALTGDYLDMVCFSNCYLQDTPVGIDGDPINLGLYPSTIDMWNTDIVIGNATFAGSLGYGTMVQPAGIHVNLLGGSAVGNTGIPSDLFQANNHP